MTFLSMLNLSLLLVFNSCTDDMADSNYQRNIQNLVCDIKLASEDISLNYINSSKNRRNDIIDPYNPVNEFTAIGETYLWVSEKMDINKYVDKDNVLNKDSLLEEYSIAVS